MRVFHLPEARYEGLNPLVEIRRGFLAGLDDKCHMHHVGAVVGAVDLNDIPAIEHVGFLYVCLFLHCGLEAWKHYPTVEIYIGAHDPQKAAYTTVSVCACCSLQWWLMG